MDADASLADAEEAEPDNPVPELKAGCQANVASGEVKTKKTKPAPRFNEASLIREMEKRGIGRPATYAAIMENISSREYVREEKGNLVPTVRGEKLVDALVGAFGFLDLDFTSRMEDRLDDIACGKLSYKECVGDFHSQLMHELEGFTTAHAVPCPECGEREQFRHIYSKEKGWNFWGCKSCGAKFADDNGRPGAKREAPELTEFSCEVCGQPLRRIKGEKGGRAYDFFGCSNKDCDAKYDNVDGKPVKRAPRPVTEFKCKKCGKPLSLYEGTSKAGKPYKKFNCSGYPKCKQSYWATEDGTPDYDNPLK